MNYGDSLDYGWIDNPVAVQAVLAAKGGPVTFADAAPHLSDVWQNEEIGLWLAAQKVNSGKHLPADLQTIGDCVSHGFGRGVDYLYCCKQSAGLVDGYVEGQTSAMTEYIYGASRQEGGGLGSTDGSVGAWAVQGLLKDGYPFREGVPYDGQKAKQYGLRGVPADLKKLAVGRLLQDYALLKTPTDMANALKSGSPCPICSNQGFTMTRDSNGVCKPQGTWGHCMLVIGVYKVANNWNFVILQSWGQNTPSGPIPSVGFPDNAFGCDWNTMGRIIAQGDSYALSGMSGWQPISDVTWMM
jgi:hypothetical protein